MTLFGVINWESLIGTIGFPAALLVMIAVGAKQLAKWLKPKLDDLFEHFLDGIREHVELVRILRASTELQNEATERQGVVLEEVGRRQVQIAKALDRHVDILADRACVSPDQLQQLAEDTARELRKES